MDRDLVYNTSLPVGPKETPPRAYVTQVEHIDFDSQSRRFGIRQIDHIITKHADTHVFVDFKTWTRRFNYVFNRLMETGLIG